MFPSTLLQPTLAQTLWLGENRHIRNLCLAILASVALWACAKIQIPFWPVPLTMQSFVVLSIGMAFGARLGAAVVMLYLVQGALGMPVFAGTPEKGIGLAYMMGPTGGYLVGFMLAAAVVGWFAERGWDRNVFTTAAAMLIGNVFIYVAGLSWLGAIIGWDKPVLELGLYPFLLGDALKLTLAALLFPIVWRMLGKKS